MVSAPLIALLYDRTFLAGSFREAWRQRRGLYLALAGTWLVLAGVVAQSPTRGNTAGFGAGISPWAYLDTQFGAIVHYLRLCAWPWPLVLDYGTRTVSRAAEIVPVSHDCRIIGKRCDRGPLAMADNRLPGGLVLRHPRAHVEHRAGGDSNHGRTPDVSAVGGRGGAGGSGRRCGYRLLVRRQWLPPARAGALGSLTVAAAASTLAAITYHATRTTAPGRRSGSIPWARRQRAGLLQPRPGPGGERGQLDKAMADYRQAIEIKPDCGEAHENLGIALANRGRIDEAIRHFRKAVQALPDDADAHYNLGTALANHGQLDEAMGQLPKNNPCPARLRRRLPQPRHCLGELRPDRGSDGQLPEGLVAGHPARRRGAGAAVESPPAGL